MESDLTPITASESFSFLCSPKVPCFNECCRDLNQLLTPYDILRLKSHLGQSSGDFLRKYTSRHTGPESGLPIVTLKPKDTHRLTCPFVTDTGCRVYENRPSSCRTYPLMRGVARSRSTGEMTEQFVLLKEPHCMGFKKGHNQTVKKWIDGQGVADYNKNNDKLMQVISLKNRLIPGPLDARSGQLFYTALYDLDEFRAQIQHDRLLDNFKINSGTLDLAMKNDVALLDLGMIWIEHVLTI
ncbi:MAG: YkgJ family cysteine cluster protein [Desulfobacterales bacterium]